MDDEEDPSYAWGAPRMQWDEEESTPAAQDTPRDTLPTLGDLFPSLKRHVSAPLSEPGPSQPEDPRPEPVPSHTEPIAAPEIFGVCLIAFDHTLGPTVEFSYPDTLMTIGSLNANLPFLALPDGAHSRNEDYTYFHMLVPELSPTTTFGISCNKQISADELINRTEDVKRSVVQKAVVVLASMPVFGSLKDKLGVVTQALFIKRDFTDKSILVDLYNSLSAPDAIIKASDDLHSCIYMGTSVSDLVMRFGLLTLTLVKLVLLQRRVLFYAEPSLSSEALCTFQYSLISLIPLLLTNLESCAEPGLGNVPPDDAAKASLGSSENNEAGESRAASPNPGASSSYVKTSSHYSLLKFAGLPLDLFCKGAFFQPYMCLQQMDHLAGARSYVIGTTNRLFLQKRPIEAIVNVNTGEITYPNASLASLVANTPQDKKWMNAVMAAVAQHKASNSLGFHGSDDYVRAKFEVYITAFLASLKYEHVVVRAADRHAAELHAASANIHHFGDPFVSAFKRTPAYRFWHRATDDSLPDLVLAHHPARWPLDDDVSVRLVHETDPAQEVPVEEKKSIFSWLRRK